MDDTSGADSGAGLFAFPDVIASGVNNIVFGNHSNSGLAPDVAGVVFLDYTCAGSMLQGTGNITDNPQFADTSVNDFSLQATSPCIDTGDPASPPDPDGTRADMGAIYFDQSEPELQIDPVSLIFTDTYLDSTDTLSLTISNIGNADLIIRNIISSRPDVFSHNWQTQDSIVVPGGNMEVEVYFTPQDTIIYNDSLGIRSNDENVTVSLTGRGLALSGVGDKPGLRPVEYGLSEPHPNPFNSRTLISYSLPVSGDVELVVFNIEGHEITRIAGGFHPAGTYSASFDAESLPSGIYIVRLQTAAYSQARKVLLVK